MELIVHEDSTARDLAVAKIIAQLIGESDGFTFGLAGGSTPRGIYERLRGMAVGWEKVDAFLGDERWVAPDDDRSNGRMAEEALFAHVPARLHRPRYSEYLTPDDSASYYEADLRSFINGGPDLMLLGMGPDRHTASLFPGSPALEEEKRWFVANPIDSEVRLTTTLPFLRGAKRLMFVANGDDKAEALADVFTSGSDAPSAQAARGDAIVEWHVDDTAARLVES
ncbi:MAG: 6-phosphogluconolactonase [Acidimicrobiia bacterium]|nr:6-phosphogluconolactonase [Acidimicrobiia bacterium]